MRTVAFLHQKGGTGKTTPSVIRWEAVLSNVMEGQPLTAGAVDCLMRLVKEPWE